MTDWKRHCDFCNEIINTRKPWLLLNRYGIGTGLARCLTQANTIGGEYLWELGNPNDEEEEGDGDYATGTLLCWPDCANKWIEGKMMTADFEIKK